MGNQFASSQRVIALCDVCGFQYKLRELKNLIVKGRDTNVKACRECWNPDQPQLRLGEFPVNDPQAIRDPRPDQSLGPSGDFSSRGIQWGWAPVGGGNDPFGLTPNVLVGTGVIGQVTVTTS
jgi:hypothetical protein|tara:strand:- start:1563 stop:1928 length:366 start_codon:yes stop_codon:yes gene_type:complete